MPEIDDLQFSQEALLNRPEFYRGYNGINLYVEDSKSEYLYEAIFKRLLGDLYSIKTIFPCDGKLGVIDAFNVHGEKKDSIKNIYLVDGDFDRFLFPEKMIHHPNFIYLKMYNIESCIINEDGLCQLIKGKLKCLEKDARDKLKYEEWRNRIINEATDLFLCYCYIQKYDPSIPNVNQNHYNIFLDGNTGFKRCDGSFERYQADLFQTHPEAEEKIAEIQEQFEQINGSHYERLICGKFLFSSLHDYIRTIVKKNISNDDLKWQMANTYDVSILYYVKEACVQ